MHLMEFREDQIGSIGQHTPALVQLTRTLGPERPGTEIGNPGQHQTGRPRASSTLKMARTSIGVDS